MQQRFELMNSYTSSRRRVITEGIVPLKTAIEDQS